LLEQISIGNIVRLEHHGNKKMIAWATAPCKEWFVSRTKI